MVDLPAHAKPIGCRWVYKIKYLHDGQIDKFKARLVAKGYTQKPGIDFNDTISPAAKVVTIRCLLILASIHGWSLTQLDVANAFLQGDLDKEIFMTLPLGYKVSGTNQVCRLRKSLCGLKQASRQWNHKFTVIMDSAKYKQSQHDHSLFMKHDFSCITLLLVYLDDIIITGNDIVSIETLNTLLHSKLHIRDLGHLKYFLGVEIAQSTQGIYLTQRKYALEIISDSGISGAKPFDTPMEQHKKLTSHDFDLLVFSANDSTIVDDLVADIESYRSLIGRLINLTITHLDIRYIVQHLSQFMNSPKQSHWTAALRVLRYFKGSPCLGLLLPSCSTLTLSAYCDVD